MTTIRSKWVLFARIYFQLVFYVMSESKFYNFYREIKWNSVKWAENTTKQLRSHCSLLDSLSFHFITSNGLLKVVFYNSKLCRPSNFSIQMNLHELNSSFTQIIQIVEVFFMFELINRHICREENEESSSIY